MAKRLPIWVALLPVALLAGGYWRWWDGRRDAFRAEVERVAPGVALKMTGFPYRLAASSGRAKRVFEGGGGALIVAAEQWEAERQPWRGGLSVVGALRPRVTLAADGLPVLRVAADSGRASVNAPGRRISSEFATADVSWSGALPPFRADRFELHVREVPGADAGRLAERAQVFARAGEVRLAGGEAFAFTMSAVLLAAWPITGIADWGAGGVARVTELRLASAKGVEVGVWRAELHADGRLAGTVVTTCPRQFAALLGGPPAPTPEYRARRPATLRFTGRLGAVRLTEPLPGLLPSRVREAPCPRLGG